MHSQQVTVASTLNCTVLQQEMHDILLIRGPVVASIQQLIKRTNRTSPSIPSHARFCWCFWKQISDPIPYPLFPETIEGLRYCAFPGLQLFLACKLNTVQFGNDEVVNRDHSLLDYIYSGQHPVCSGVKSMVTITCLALQQVTVSAHLTSDLPFCATTLQDQQHKSSEAANNTVLPVILAVSMGGGGKLAT